MADSGPLISLDDPAAAAPELTGAKAATLARARRHGLPVLPGYVVPAAEGEPALRAGCHALQASGRPSARRAVFAVPVRPGLVTELERAVRQLGGRAIVRSSSPLESDPRWSGAFSSIREIGVDDVAAAVRSCWASAFAPDPLDRLEQCGLEPARLGLSLLVQPDLAPDFGGLARTGGAPTGGAGTEGVGTEVSWTAGHPGALLAGVAEGQSVRVPAQGEVRPEAAGVLGPVIAGEVARLARAVHAFSGHEVIEWAWADGSVHLLQSGPGQPDWDSPEGAADPGDGVVRVVGTACVAGDAVGSLRFAAPGQPPAGPGPCILVATQPFAALAPLLFGAQGVVCQSGPADCHLASVAGALGVPMLVRMRLREVVGPLAALGDDSGWLGAISGQRAELALTRAASRAPADQERSYQAVAGSVAGSMAAPG